ncbi:hypothetical protein [Thiobacter aerophilum]|uniref:Kazal-like domain-containing protein n=1 Tax=Thiobacter aerophilum TaxID=3121275 RepID=A0ABV0ECQ2_9BURK
MPNGRRARTGDPAFFLAAIQAVLMAGKTISVLATLWLAACAAMPRHQTVKAYLAPPAVQSCVEGCARERERCQKDCGERFQRCRQSLLPEAQARHQQRLKEYESALAQYRWELERYRLELMLGWGGCHPYWGGWLSWPPFPPGPPPSAPTLEKEIERLSRERCDRDCGCETAYDVCFQACGGSIRYENRCVAGCAGAP